MSLDRPPLRPVEEERDDTLARLLSLAAGPVEDGSGRPEPELEERVRLASRAAWRRTAGRRRRRRWALAAAAGLAAFSLGLFFWRQGTTSHPNLPEGRAARVEAVVGALRLGVSAEDAALLAPGSAIPFGVPLETFAEARAALSLGEDTSLRLDQSTRMRFLGPRSVALESGALYVDSQRGEGLPNLEIHTPYGVARDIGTQFEVRLRDGTLRLRVREGRVDLAGSGRTYEALAGAELTLAADGAVRQRVVSRFGEAWEWSLAVAPAFELEGSTLAEYLAWVVRETGWNLAFDDPALAGLAPATHLFGSIGGRTPPESLELVLATCGLTHRLDGGTLIVLRADPPGGRDDP